ncbi:MAG: energy transducer TonB [Alphaproteobacteria bacterium]|nr:MAG: energy transducer TonB [Alphaproteobacteria bacterium]
MVRLGSAVVGAALVTFGLFYLMQLLIATGEKAIVDKVVGYRVEIGEVKRQEETRTKERKPEKPEEPEAPPEAPDIPEVDTSKPQDAMDMSFQMGAAKLDIGTGMQVGAPTDGDYLPIVRVQPQYPRRAAERGIEGYVIVELTVTEAGTTTDIRVVEAQPEGIFDRAAIRAAEKFKYKPKVVNGKPVPVSGVLYQFTFELEK